MKTNKISQEVWDIFVSKVGANINKWNLTNWLSVDEDFVSFSLDKPLFRGVVTISKLDSKFYLISFSALDWYFTPTGILNADELANFVDKLGNDYSNEQFFGQRAPSEDICNGVTSC